MQSDFDLLIIGGGINGCGIARDAAGRGLSVCLAEMGDIGGATSSASTKLFHGGLRYLEYFEVRLVREALAERETLLRAMPHISWPMRFVLPYHPSMRFDSTTPTSRLLNTLMPWMQGHRPGWLIRLGLFLYDNLGGRKILPGTTRVDLTNSPEGAPLNPMFKNAFEYSDCWVEDARLVVLNARDAEARGAKINPRTKVTKAEPLDGGWRVALTNTNTGTMRHVTARMLVNAAGPWVAETLGQTLGSNAPANIRLVRGSHIVTKRLFEHDKCYFFQGQDGRIIFAIPYETDFTLIGTTDADHVDPDTPPRCSDAERDYLIAFINEYIKDPIAAEDVVWTYSGVRPLFDDGDGSAAAATRDYVLRTDHVQNAPVLNIFGGKITTYRRLAESALGKIEAELGALSENWTAGVPLPGGDFPVDGFDALVEEVLTSHPFLTLRHAKRLVRAYGTDARGILGSAKSLDDLGQNFGATLTEAELRWLINKEYAQQAEDVVWRRSKLGLLLSAEQIDAIDAWMQAELKTPT